MSEKERPKKITVDGVVYFEGKKIISEFRDVFDNLMEECLTAGCRDYESWEYYSRYEDDMKEIEKLLKD